MDLRDPHDIDDLDNHHPPCAGPCGQLADECMCRWVPPVIDGSDPAAMEHLCCRDLLVRPGPVEECCADLWRDEGVEP